jgi:hypothetical protein
VRVRADVSQRENGAYTFYDLLASAPSSLRAECSDPDSATFIDGALPWVTSLRS